MGTIQVLHVFKTSLPQRTRVVWMFSQPSSKVQFQIIEHIVTEIDLLEQHAVLDTVYIRQLVRRTVQSNQILRQSQKSKLVMLALQLYQRGEMLQIQ